jgi:transcriptional regulator with XRE-family HTH domain
MTEPFPLKACLAALRMRQAELARIMGRSPTTVNRWATGQAETPRDAQMFVVAMLMLPKAWLHDFRMIGDPVAIAQQLIAERLPLTARPPRAP